MRGRNINNQNDASRYRKPEQRSTDARRFMNIKDAKQSTSNAQKAFDDLCVTFWDATPYVPTMGTQHELEIKFATLEGSSPISRTDYDNVIKQLLSLGFTSKNTSGEYLLRINTEYLDHVSGKHKLSNYRTEIKGFSAIQSYCQNNDILAILNDPTYSRSVTIQKKSNAPSNNGQSNKKFIDSVEFLDFDFKSTLSIEESFNTISRSGLVKSTVDSWNKSKKTFRYLNRITFEHEDYPVKVDISIVKSSNITKTGMMERTYTTTESNVFYAREKYEIEIEVDNTKIGPGTKCVNAMELILAMKKVAKFVMMGLQETNFPVAKSEYHNVTQQYMSLIGQNPEYRLETKHFIGPSSYTLQLSNIQETVEDTTEPNIRKDYTVTDKADGERRLMFITHVGDIYLINTNMKLLFTGAKTKNEKYFNSLLDGEIILHDKNGKYINLYAVFDIYMVNKVDVRAHIFTEHIVKDAGKKGDDVKKTRFNFMNELVNNINAHSVVKDITNPIRIVTKTFYIGTESTSIFSGCSTILKRAQDGLFEYNTDGLIFTPARLGVGSHHIGEAGPLKKITWDYSFKWKPVEFNTIDFMVTTVKNVKLEDISTTVFEQGVNAATNNYHKKYKTLTLRCGFDEKVHGYMNPCQDVLNDVVPGPRDNNIGGDATGYQPMQFIPTDPYDADAGLCNIMLHPNSNGDDTMYTEENDVIEDNTIVEFKYDITRKKGWNWIPLRVRYDKTSELRKGIKNFGNAYHVANSNWHSIHYPVIEDMIRSGQNIPENNRDDDVYYKKTKGVSYTQSLRDFHNLIKTKLITGVARKGDTLIDVACGKGGDLPKWIKAKVSFVFGVDLSPDNIENRLDGACARYLNFKKTNPNIPRALFVVGNSEFNIRSGQAIETEKGKQITASVFGNIAKDEKLGKGVSKNYAIGEEGFNVSSCQFALHYFFKDKHTLHRFLANVSECTKIGGHFVGACYDGDKIFTLLKSKQVGEEVELYHKKKKIWGVKRLYPEDDFVDNATSLGYTIRVFQESINNYIDEYLVNFTYFTRLMENYGFKVIADSAAEEMGFPTGLGSFDAMYNKVVHDMKVNPRMKNEYGTSENMQPYEKTISFNNKYFIFKKISNVNVDNVIRAEKSDTEESNINLEIDKQTLSSSLSKNQLTPDIISSEKVVASTSSSTTGMMSPKKTGKTMVIRRPKKLNQTIMLQDASNPST